MFKTLLFIISLTVTISSADIDFDIDKIAKDANQSNKQVMLFFHKDYCGYCNKMEEHIESPQLTQEIQKDFIFISINRDDDESISYQDFRGSNHEFAKALGINFYPTLVFIEGNGTIVHDVSGYRKEETISTILKYMSRKAYQKMSLESFENDLEFE